MRKLWFFLTYLILIVSCEKDQVQLPVGPGTAKVDSVVFTQQDFDSLTVKYNSSSSASSLYNYVGAFRDAECKTVLAFTNFTAINDTKVDVDNLVIKSAKIILKEYKTWGSAELFTFQTALIPTSKDFAWSDTTDFDTYWKTVKDHLIPLNTSSYSPDTLIIPLDCDVVNGWWNLKQDESNNGIVLDFDPNNPDGIIGYYSSNSNTVSDWPYLKVTCTIYDSLQTKDSTYTIYANKDFTYSELRNTDMAPDFFVSQGAIRRAFITSSQFLPTLEGKSINYSELSLVVDPTHSYFDEDSLTIYIGLFTSENWETKNFLFSSYQNSGLIKKSDKKVSLPITEVMMDMQDNAETAISGIFIRLGQELYGFNQIAFDPDSLAIKIVTTEF